MKIYKNQTKQSAHSLGFGGNFEFASCEYMNPNGIDIMAYKKDGELIHWEVTEYDKDSKVARIMLMNQKELDDYKLGDK